ncbi:MAG: response regulator [Proteobacteria bacterium]|nr:response regulator [Pseudomonadota bacterium]
MVTKTSITDCRVGQADITALTRVLIVDDMATSRELVKAALASRQYEMTEAASGKEALELISNKPFDLVLLDLEMSDMNGIEVIRQLRKRHTPIQLPIIMLTSSESGDDIVTALETGANDYVVKGDETWISTYQNQT